MLSYDDRQFIMDVVSRYAHCVDRADVAGVVACFSDETDAGFEGGSVRVRGRAELADFYERSLLDPDHGASDGSTHLMGNVLVSGDDQGARVETEAVVFRVYAHRNTTVMRGVRYSDVFVKRDDNWLIRNRVHQLVWQSEVPGVSQAFVPPHGVER